MPTEDHTKKLIALIKELAEYLEGRTQDSIQRRVLLHKVGEELKKYEKHDSTENTIG